MGTLKGYCRLQFLLIFIFCSSQAAQFHVAPNATSGGNGSLSNPWQLQAALSQPAAVHAGDTIWVHGGVYVNPHAGQDAVAWKSTLQGSASSPIIVRVPTGESARIDGGDSQQNNILEIDGNYTWYWGLEVYSSDPARRTPSTGSFPPASDIHRGECVTFSQDFQTQGNKVINCIIHDGFNGFAAWVPANTEAYGCLIYNNGWFAPDRPHGHNIYVQNQAGETRKFADCITWGAFENNIQAYGTQNVDDFVFDGHISASVAETDGAGILLGSDAPVHNPTITNGMFYGIPNHQNFNLGWHAGGGGVTGGNVTNNYIGGGEVYFFGPFSNINVSNNSAYYVYTETSNMTTLFPNNTWSGSLPSGVKVFVRPNQYEAGRANVAIFNWDHKSSVAVDLSAVFKSGDHYTVVDAMNPSVIVASGSYSGAVSIPMTGLVAASPIGEGTRTHTAPEFGVFIATGGSITPPPPTNPPAVNTAGATNITPTGAQFNGSVNSNGLSTTYHFDYGTTTSYGSSTSTASAGSGTNSVSVNATVSGLTTGTVYHYRLVGANSAGTTNGNDVTFTAGPPPAQAPVVNTSSATNVTSTGAQLNGSVNPNGASTTYHFDYGTSTSYGSSTSTANAGSGTSSVSVNAAVNGLTPGTLYHYRLSGTNSGGTTNGNDITFTAGTPPTQPPTTTTSTATNVTATGARLNGSVNPNGFSTTYHFDYGTSTSYGSSTSTANAGSGTSSVGVNATVGSLTAGTLYHFRLVGTNSGGTTNGNDLTFTPTSSQKPLPKVSTSAASDISTTGAQLNGSVNPNGSSTTYYFEYGLTSSYGSTTPTSTAGSGTSVLDVSASLDNLTPGTIYLYRLVATSSTGTTYGPDASFATQAAPTRAGTPEAHALMPNYPNPFNPATTIQYDLYQAGEVTMKIYSAIGVEVATLVSGFQLAGRHSVQWDPSGFVSGVYFCTLKSGGLVSTRRMILLK